MKFVWAFAALSMCRLSAQSPSSGSQVLRNSGSPMNVGFRCTDDDLQWAGMTCSDDEPCPMYLELLHIAAVGQKIFVTGDVHSDANTLYSILVASGDGGATWNEPFARIRGGGLDQIQFFDSETGWISGQSLQPLPSDPFLLLSTDGGRNWRKRHILDEGSPGSISAFWFDSRKNGALLVDRGQSETNRYQLYESPTGGESWMIRETSPEPIKIAAMPRVIDEAWRIRADASTKSFRIEKRGGTNWNTVASFLFRVADCKPEPRAERSPPSDSMDQPKPATDDFVRELRLGGPPADAPKKLRSKPSAIP
ncbi:MAG: hypothetical protein M3Z85_17560 [Acidobacteriota bacterium]|nr:hypothetical protein [Acidobacteriota bacterium]